MPDDEKPFLKRLVPEDDLVVKFLGPGPYIPYFEPREPRPLTAADLIDAFERAADDERQRRLRETQRYQAFLERIPEGLRDDPEMRTLAMLAGMSESAPFHPIDARALADIVERKIADYHAAQRSWYCRLCGVEGPGGPPAAYDHAQAEHVKERYYKVVAESFGKTMHVWAIPKYLAPPKDAYEMKERPRA